MSTGTTASRGLAIAAGLAFAGGALSILLHDLIDMCHPANMLQHWTLQHTLAVLVVVGVVLAGELAREARLERVSVSGLGFGSLSSSARCSSFTTASGGRPRRRSQVP